MTATTVAEMDEESAISAIADEFDAVGKMNVWRRIHENSHEIPAGIKIVPNERSGDNDKLDISARLVPCEVKWAAGNEPFHRHVRPRGRRRTAQRLWT